MEQPNSRFHNQVDALDKSNQLNKTELTLKFAILISISVKFTLRDASNLSTIARRPSISEEKKDTNIFFLR